MVRRVFYSFHYDPDNSKASQVRNIGAVEGNKPASDNDWETVKKGGDKAIQKWIDESLDGRSCTIVLIGQNTAGRKWIKYEIEKSWNDAKGVVGIYIHNLKDLNGKQAYKGRNPFEDIKIEGGKKILSNVVNAYNPPFNDSKEVYNYIKIYIEHWIEEAIIIRKNY